MEWDMKLRMDDRQTTAGRRRRKREIEDAKDRIKFLSVS